MLKKKMLIALGVAAVLSVSCVSVTVWAEENAEEQTEEAEDSSNSEGEEGTDFVLDYIYQHFIEFKLIFCCSTGSQYEHFLDELGKIEESYYQELVDKYGKEGFTVDPFFIHVFCRAGWQTMYELVAHDCSYKEAQSFMNSTKLFNVAGWKADMGIDD